MLERIGQESLELAEVLEHAPALSMALNIFTREGHTWFTLYHIYELAEDKYGIGMIEHKWGLTDARRFRVSANEPSVAGRGARHSVSKKKQLKLVPLSLDDARKFIGALLERWIEFEKRGANTRKPRK
jgi:hypothetical protein